MLSRDGVPISANCNFSQIPILQLVKDAELLETIHFFIEFPLKKRYTRIMEMLESFPK